MILFSSQITSTHTESINHKREKFLERWWRRSGRKQSGGEKRKEKYNHYKNLPDFFASGKDVCKNHWFNNSRPFVPNYSMLNILSYAALEVLPSFPCFCLSKVRGSYLSCRVWSVASYEGDVALWKEGWSLESKQQILEVCKEQIGWLTLHACGNLSVPAQRKPKFSTFCFISSL